MAEPMVVRDIPVASANAAIPPCPKLMASVADQSRRARSLRKGWRVSYFDRSVGMKSACLIPSLNQIPCEITNLFFRGSLIARKGYTDEELPTQQTINKKLNLLGYCLT